MPKITTKQLEVKPTAEDPLLPMRQREAEPDHAYHGFLLWALQDSGARSVKYLSRSADLPESNLRFWAKRWGWSARVASVTSHEIAAFQLLQGRLAELDEPERLLLLQDAFDRVLKDKAPASLRSYFRRQRKGLEDTPATRTEEVQKSSKPTPDPALADVSDLGTQIKEKHLQARDVSRQVMLIDACLGMIAKKVQSGDLQVSVKDIPSLIKARALLTGLPTQNVAVHAQVEHNVTVQSVRVQRAQALNLGEQGVLSAMREDLEELNLIMRQIEPDKDRKVLTVTPE